MRPDPRRLHLSAYPHTLEVPARFSDLDPQNHLNNVAIGNFYEEGRSHFNRRALAGLIRRSGLRMMMANVSISYLREGRYPGVLTVATGVLYLGNSSFTLGQALFQGGVCIGVAESVTVHLSDGAPAPLPPDFRDALASLLVEATPNPSKQTVGDDA